MLIEKDTKEATSKFFAVADINARAAAAYTANKQLFNSVQHTTKVELVDSILKTMFIGYATAYQTSRAATKKRAAHTEVKYFRSVLRTVKQLLVCCVGCCCPSVDVCYCKEFGSCFFCVFFD